MIAPLAARCCVRRWEIVACFVLTEKTLVRQKKSRANVAPPPPDEAQTCVGDLFARCRAFGGRIVAFEFGFSRSKRALV